MTQTYLGGAAGRLASVHRIDLPCHQTGFLCPPLTSCPSPAGEPAAAGDPRHVPERKSGRPWPSWCMSTLGWILVIVLLLILFGGLSITLF